MQHGLRPPPAPTPQPKLSVPGIGMAVQRHTPRSSSTQTLAWAKAAKKAPKHICLQLGAGTARQKQSAWLRQWTAAACSQRLSCQVQSSLSWSWKTNLLGPDTTGAAAASAGSHPATREQFQVSSAPSLILKQYLYSPTNIYSCFRQIIWKKE